MTTPEHPAGKVTMRLLADRLGVSPMTVSRALSGRRKMDPVLAERVRDLAKRLGYRPDPVVSGVMRTLKRGGEAPATVAFVWTDERSHVEREYHGVCAEARRLGYRVEAVRPWERGLSPRDVTRILWARGVRGVLLAPNESAPHPRYAMDWDKFSAVLLGSSLANAGMPRVQSDHYHAAKTAVTRLQAAGFLRIGLVLEAGYHERADRAMLAAYLAHGTGADPRRVFLFDGAEEPGSRQTRFEAWLRDHRPDVVLGDVAVRMRWLGVAGLRLPQDISFATLTATPEVPDLAGASGMLHDMERVGAEALRLLDRMLCNNQTGRCENPVRIMVRGHWLSGKTLGL